MKSGSTVRLKQPEIKGKVLKQQFNNDQAEALVEYESEGQTHRKWFPQDRLDEIQDAAEVQQ